MHREGSGNTSFLVGMPVFSFAESSVVLPLHSPRSVAKDPYSKFEKSVKLENSNTRRKSAYKIGGQFSLPIRPELFHSEPAPTRKDAPKVNLHGIKSV